MEGKQYSIEQIHAPKKYGVRRSGKIVDTIMDAIGQLMVTENETIYFYVSWMDRTQHIKREYFDVVRYHFNETPILYKQFEIGIKGYSSRIIFKRYNYTDPFEHERTYGDEALSVWDLD